MNWFKKLLGFKDTGTFEIVYSKCGTWKITTYGKNFYNEYCHFDIFYNDVTKKYKLEYRGHKPESHPLHNELFKYMRMLNEELAYIRGGEIYIKKESDSGTTNGKDISSMNETECQAYLNRALEEEDYELAEKIRKQLEKFN